MRQDLAHLRHCVHLFLWWVVYAHKADYLRFGQKRDQDHTPDLLRRQHLRQRRHIPAQLFHICQQQRLVMKKCFIPLCHGFRHTQLQQFFLRRLPRPAPAIGVEQPFSLPALVDHHCIAGNMGPEIMEHEA